MPTIVVKKSRLLKLIGVNLDDQTLNDMLFNVKIEASKVNEDLWELEITPDRLDMLMCEGIARTLRGLLGLEKGIPRYEIIDSNYKLIVDPSVLKVRPYIAVAIVYDYNMDVDALQEIIQLQEKLHQTIGRGRRKVAIGIHNLDAIPSKNLHYKALELDKVKFKPLDEFKEMSGREILELTEKGLLYGDIIKPYKLAPIFSTVEGEVLSMPPIINSELTRVYEDTKNVLIDVTGTDLLAVETTINVITYSLAENAKRIGRVVVEHPSMKVKSYPIEAYDKVKVDFKYLTSSLGLNLTLQDVIENLERMRFNVKSLGDNTLEVEVPAYRYDILHPVDLVEELAIAIGYDRIEPRPPKTYTIGKELTKNSLIKLVRDLMVGLGFQEIFTFMLSSNELQVEVLEWGPKCVELLNPISPGYNVLRSWLTPETLEFLRANQHLDHPIKVFEIGDVIVPNEKLPEKCETRTKLVAAMLSSRAGYEDIQASLYPLLKELNLEFTIKPGHYPFLIDGRSANILVDDEVIGFIGEVHPKILTKMNIEYPVAIFEIDLTNLYKR